MSPHSQELAAVKMLNTLDLTPSNFHNFVQDNDVDLDVADSKGNTRLMISSVMVFFFQSLFSLTAIYF